MRAPLRRVQRRLLTACVAFPARALTRRRRSVRISALALVKMTMHCRSGGNLEARPRCGGACANPGRADACCAGALRQVMGMMQGKVIGDTFIVLDSFALPVEGSRVRSAAQFAPQRR